MKEVALFTITTAAILAFTGSFFCRSAAAAEKQSGQYDSYCRSRYLAGIGDINRRQKISINSIENPIYCTFENDQDALNNLKKKVPEILLAISSQFRLDEINSQNWEEYRAGLYGLSSDSVFAHDTNQQRATLVAFFDIFENRQKNDEIIKYTNRILVSNNTRQLSQSQTLSLGLMLPYYAPLAKDSERIINLQRATSIAYALPNMNAAINYARTYAVNYNTNGYGVAKGGFLNLIEMDCTNFVSQILEASGVSQDVYPVDTKGWWHKNHGGQHLYSVSWINADTFSRYMGVGFKTTNHTEFSSVIDKGDFIASDKANDGNWDHMGFVTNKDNTYRYYSNGDYYNYEVAQHTEGYIKWADKNGWPMTGGALGRVRR